MKLNKKSSKAPSLNGRNMVFIFGAMVIGKYYLEWPSSLCFTMAYFTMLMLYTEASYSSRQNLKNNKIAYIAGMLLAAGIVLVMCHFYTTLIWLLPENVAILVATIVGGVALDRGEPTA